MLSSLRALVEDLMKDLLMDARLNWYMHGSGRTSLNTLICFTPLLQHSVGKVQWVTGPCRAYLQWTSRRSLRLPSPASQTTAQLDKHSTGYVTDRPGLISPDASDLHQTTPSFSNRPLSEHFAPVQLGRPVGCLGVGTLWAPVFIMEIPNVRPGRIFLQTSREKAGTQTETIKGAISDWHMGECDHLNSPL